MAYPNHIMSTATAKHVNPRTWERLLTILSFPLVGLALGVPWWIGTTSIERRSLGAVDKVRGFGSEEGRVKVVVRGDEADVWSLWVAACVQERGWELVTEREGGLMDPVIQLVDKPAGSPPYLTTNGTLIFPVQVDPIRHLASPGDAGADASSHECSAVRSSAAQSTLDMLVPIQPKQLPPHAIKYAEELRLSFVLLNEDATVGKRFTRWEIEQGVQAYIQPLMDALAPFHKFTVESQVLHHAPIKFNPERRGEGIWTVSTAQAGVFVNTEQWTLDSGSTNNPVLRFLLFLPRADRRPLVLEDAIPSNSSEIPQLSTFRIPQFGSVVIPAFPKERQEGDGYLATEQLRAAFRVFRKDLLELLGVPAVPASLLQETHGPQSAVPNAWQVSALLRTQIRATTAEAIATLTSIQRLVARIQEMRVGKEVVGDVERAVGLLEEAYAVGGKRTLRWVWERTKGASALADRAFFNPSMVGLLYFPDEHKYAVYAPLFAPISVPVIVAILKEVKRWKRKRKARGEGAVVGNGDAVEVAET